MSLNDVFTSAQTIIPDRDPVCKNLSFQNIFAENLCTGNRVCFRLDISVYMLKCVVC